MRRARVVLLLEEGRSSELIMRELRCDSRFITTWKTRFVMDRLAGLYASAISGHDPDAACTGITRTARVRSS